MDKLICTGMNLVINPLGLRYNIDNIDIQLHDSINILENILYPSDNITDINFPHIYNKHIRTNTFAVNVDDSIEMVSSDKDSTHILLNIFANNINDIVVYPTYNHMVDRFGKYKTIHRNRGVCKDGSEYTLLTAVFDKAYLKEFVIRLHGINVRLIDILNDTYKVQTHYNIHGILINPMVNGSELCDVLDCMDLQDHRLYINNKYIAIKNYEKGNGNIFKIIDEYNDIKLISIKDHSIDRSVMSFNMNTPVDNADMCTILYFRYGMLKKYYGKDKYNMSITTIKQKIINILPVK